MGHLKVVIALLVCILFTSGLISTIFFPNQAYGLAIPVGVVPVYVAIDETTNTLYVVNQGSNDVTVIDGATNSVITTISVGTSPSGAEFIGSVNRLYVLNQGSSNISVIDTTTNTVIQTISGVSTPIGQEFNPNSNRLYIGNGLANTVTVINVLTNTVLGAIPVGNNPTAMELNQVTEKLYVSNFGSDSISVIDIKIASATSHTVVATIPIPGGVAHAGIDESTNTLYVPAFSSDQVHVIDASTNTIIDSITVGDSPRRAIFNADPKQVLVTSFDTNTLSVIAASTNSVVAIVSVDTPFGMNLNKVTDLIYVTNQFSDTLTVVNLAANSPSLGVIAKGSNVPGTTPETRAPSTVMNDGIPIGVVVPPNFDGVMIYDQEESATSSKYILVSQVVNITPVNGTAGDAPDGNECEGKCDVIFVIHESNVIKAGLPVEELCNLKILHDVNDDGDFDDANEVLDTIVTDGGGFPGGSSKEGGNGTSTGLVKCGSDPTTPGSGSGGGSGGGKPKPGFRVRSDDVPDFSKFAVGGVVSLSSGGSGGSGGGSGGGSHPPSFSSSSFAVIDGGEEGFGGILNDNDAKNFEKTNTFKVGEKAVLRFDFTEGGGIGKIEHIALYTNIRDGQKKYDSDTYITYDPFKSPSLVVHDPNGFFDLVDFDILEKNVTNFVLKFDLTFAKPMAKSDLILESWNIKKWSSENKIPNAIEVLSSGIVQEIQSEPVETFLEDVTDDTIIPMWVKSNAKWWSENKIDNDNFISGLEYLVNEGMIKVSLPDTTDNTSISEVQPWIKSTAGWWADGMINDDEFLTSIEWMISNNLIQVAT